MRLIDADALKPKATYMHGFGGNKYVPLKAIENAPTIEAEPVRHGRWIKVGESCGVNIIECSECHTIHAQDGDAFCRDCGAKMDGEQE